MIYQDNRDYFKKRLVYFKGSDGGGDSFDAAYNNRMATIAESQQGMAEDYYNFWKESYKPMEEAQINANMDMIPGETDLAIAKNDSALSLLPGQTELAAATNESNLALLPGQTEAAQKTLALTGAQADDAQVALKEKAPVRNAFFKESLDGLDVEGEANKAGADAAHSFANSEAVMGRGAARMGVNPNSGKFASMTNTNAINRAKTISGARTTARSGAEKENYGRLTNAMGY